MHLEVSGSLITRCFNSPIGRFSSLYLVSCAIQSSQEYTRFGSDWNIYIVKVLTTRERDVGWVS
jgi:hypothetical protein